MNIRPSEVEVIKCAASLNQLDQLIKKCLPKQGSIEIQNDVPGKEHTWHEHDTDETLVILSGAVRFYWKNTEVVCYPGDVIKLPKFTQHGSVALNNGATYIISFEQVNI